MDIAIIGTGRVGGTLARAWARAGHRIVLGAREPGGDDVRSLAAELGGETHVATPSDAATAADVVVLAIPGDAVVAAALEHAPASAGRVVIVPANDMARAAPNLAAAVAAAPGARVARAFNTVAAETMAAPTLDGRAVDMLYAAVDDDTGRAVGQLIADCGFRPVLVGGLEQAALLDSLFALWAALAFGQQRGRGIAFAIVGGDGGGLTFAVRASGR